MEVNWLKVMGNRRIGMVGGKRFGVTISGNGTVGSYCCVDEEGHPDDNIDELSGAERAAIFDAVGALLPKAPSKKDWTPLERMAERAGELAMQTLHQLRLTASKIAEGRGRGGQPGRQALSQEFAGQSKGDLVNSILLDEFELDNDRIKAALEAAEG